MSAKWIASFGAVVLVAAGCGASGHGHALLRGSVRKVPGARTLSRYACPPVGACVAVGQSVLDARGDRDGAVVPVEGGRPQSEIDVNDVFEINDVACPRPRFCLAVSADRSGKGGAVIPIADGRPRRTIFVPGVGDLASIGCASGSSCWALGADPTGKKYPVAVHITRSSVKVFALTGASPGLFTGGYIGGVASPFCTKQNVCIAVGAAPAGPPVGGPAAVTVLADGKIRSVTPVPGVDDLVGLACTKLSWCIATGFVDPIRGYAVVVTIVNGKPIAERKLRGFSQEPSGTSSLGQPACQSTRVCWAFGFQGLPNEAVAIPIDDGKPGAAQPAAIDGQGTWCDATGCVAVGELANHPSVVGAIYPFS